MKRRDFLTKGTAVAGLVSSANLVPPLMADQLQRNIVPRRGFCSIAPGSTASEGLTSGNVLDWLSNRVPG